MQQIEAELAEFEIPLPFINWLRGYISQEQSQYQTQEMEMEMDAEMTKASTPEVPTAQLFKAALAQTRETKERKMITRITPPEKSDVFSRLGKRATPKPYSKPSPQKPIETPKSLVVSNECRFDDMKNN